LHNQRRELLPDFENTIICKGIEELGINEQDEVKKELDIKIFTDEDFQQQKILQANPSCTKDSEKAKISVEKEIADTKKPFLELVQERTELEISDQV
jgi:hypothetical protein